MGVTTWTRGGCQTTDTTGKNPVVSSPSLYFEHFIFAVLHIAHHDVCHVYLVTSHALHFLE